MKNLFTYILFFFVISLSFISWVSAHGHEIFDTIAWWSNSNATIYCQGSQCSLTGWIDAIKGSLWGIETTRSASQYVQDLVIYVLGFITLIAVIYVIYAWFMIMIGNGDEERLKKSKQTILYVAIGIAVIWFAYPITLFIIQVLNATPAP